MQGNCQTIRVFAREAQEFRNGFFDQTVQLWSEGGTMLATSHQIVYYKE